MAISKVVVVDGNNLIVQIDRGVAGRGVTNVEPVEIDNSLYLVFTFSDGTTDTVGPVGTIQYIGQSPIVVTGSTISLSTVPVSLGGTGATTAAAARTNLNAADQATTISAGTGLSGGGSLAANRTINIANTAVTAGSYGSASNTLSATVNAQGQLTALAATPIAVANTQVSGLGTMSTQNANSVAITGGSVTGITDLAVVDGGTGASDASGARTNLGAAASAITINAGTGLSGGGDLSSNRTLSIASTGVTAAAYGSASKTLTATVNAQGQLTVLADTNIAIANTQVSGLGTASTLNAGVALGVATLDAGGTVPLSQIPASIQGGVSYQGSWNAATNTPTLTSSVGSKGYYYVVSVAGSTNLNGITNWLPGDWAIFNGTAWEKIDNTDAVASVNGYTGVVVLTAADVGAPPTTRTISAGTGLSGGGDLSANRTISLANTAVTAGSYGSASKTLTATVNAQGQLTALSASDIAIANTQVSGLGTMSTQNANNVSITGGSVTGITDLAIADGGTGQSTAAAAITALTGTQVAGRYLRSDGTNAALSAIQAADVPTLNQNTTGTAAGLSATLAISSGGTGQTTANAAFNALAPSQTGNSGKYLTTDGSNTSWATNPLGTVTSVGVSGGTTGLTTSGGPVTTSGTITLAGTLATTNGGTGLTSFTANQVFYASSTSAFAQSSNLQFSGTDLTVYGITVGRGAGAVITNTAVGGNALIANTTGNLNAAIGYYAMASNTTGNSNTAMGYYALASNSTGYANVAIGRNSLTSNTTGFHNIAIGSQDEISIYGVLRSNTTGNSNNAIGSGAMQANTTGGANTALGHQTLFSNTTASNNTAVGYQAGYSNTTGANVTVFGNQAGYSGVTGYITAFGFRAGYSSTGSNDLTAIGDRAAFNNTTGYGNTALGTVALSSNTTGGYNTALGLFALYSNTTASYNTAVGYQAGYTLTTGAHNVLVGPLAGYSLTTGYNNTFIGTDNGADYTCGGRITTGSKNTIIGGYSGNQGGLDIRTASNYIVLSDGDGNPRIVVDGGGFGGIGVNPANQYAAGGGASWQVGRSTNIWNYSVSGNDQTRFYNNAYLDTGAGDRYLNTNRASMLQMADGRFFVRSAPSGSAGALVTFTTVLDVSLNETLALQGATSQAGTGITFPATQSASSNANTLDDYEEGTWTPSLIGGITPGTATTGDGYYTKVGNLVTVFFKIENGNSPSGASGPATISGLPFSVNSTYIIYSYGAPGLIYTNGGASITAPNWSIRTVDSGSYNQFYFQYQANVNANVSSLNISDLGSTGNYFRGYFSYQTNT